MSKNKNQSNKRANTTAAKPAHKDSVSTEDQKATPDNKTASNNVPDTVNKTTDKATDAKTAEKQSTTTDKVSAKNSEKPLDAKAATSADKPATSATKDNQSVNQPTDKQAMKNKAATDTSENKADKTSSKTAAKAPEPTPTLKTADAQPQKKSGLGVGLALLLGVAGTGLGAYSFNELRNLKAGSSETQQLSTQLGALNQQVTDLAKSTETDSLKKQLADLLAQQQALKAAEAKFNQRVAAVEQMQKGLSKSVATDINTALQARMGAVDTLLAKVKDIELGQEGLSKNLSQVSAGSQAVSNAGMQQQEVGYLLRMASYKLQSEGDVLGATGLLKMAESKLLMANQGKADALVDAVRAKIIQLSGVQSVDTDALIAELKNIGREIPKLVVKSHQPTAVNAANTENVGAETDDSVLGKIGSVIASGVKYTPNDPSKIDISAETILIEKRLMQADVKTAEFAVQSHNNVLLAESVKSIQESLGAYFANDATAQLIQGKLTAISQSELTTVLPDLSGIVKQFEANQAQ